MKIDDNVKALINKVNEGKMHSMLELLDGSDFGLYIPVYVDDYTVKPMLSGYSQSEKDLVVSLSKGTDDIHSDAKPVAWIGGNANKDTTCLHAGIRSCTHCSDHPGPTRSCGSHGTAPTGGLIAPELDYNSAMEEWKNKKDLLTELAKEDFGLTLLHGHNSEFTFTKLPVGYVSVVSDGITSFRTRQEVEQDTNFVPNIWRSVNGQLEVAGGYSTS